MSEASGIRDIELPNGMRISCASRQDASVLFSEIFEQKVYLQHGIQVTPGSTVLDIGANIGLFSLELISSVADIRIYAFEPMPHTYEILRRNLAMGGPAVTILPLALGRRVGQITGTYYVNAPYLSTTETKSNPRSFVLQWMKKEQPALLATATQTELDSLIAHLLLERSIKCEMTTVSSIIRKYDLSQVDLMKVDVEGAELDVLRGVELAHWPLIRQIAIETHGDQIAEDAQSLLTTVGFSTVHNKIPNLPELGYLYGKRNQFDSA